MDYGKFNQRFPVDSTHQIILGDEIERLHSVIRDSKRVIITGNPGLKAKIVRLYIIIVSSRYKIQIVLTEYVSLPYMEI